jgi:uncharacterized membrane protein YsdA (DUF1294 family)/cold shock CspA family protein
MRFQGRITTWKDDKGFGFIAPNGGGEPVFLHIKTFANRQRRPVANEIVTYELTTDERQRPRATNVAFVGERRLERSRVRHGWVAVAVVTLFLALIVAAVVTDRVPRAVLGIYLGASVIAFVAYAIDKTAAQKDRWRTQESTLHLLALIGGWPGAYLAQKALRHKSKKRDFQTVFWATVILNCGALIVYSSRTASQAVMSLIGVIR